MATPEHMIWRLYGWMGVGGAAGALAVTVWQGLRPAMAFLLGMATMMTLLALWHGALWLGLQPGRAQPALVGLLILARYALIGLGIYAIMRLLGDFLLSHLTWFLAGTLVLIPSLVFNEVFPSRRTGDGKRD